MPLTDTQIKNLKPTARLVKVFDGGGLFIEVTPSGSKRWRLKYRFGGKEKLISLGLYPEITLKVARERRDDARKQIAHNINPSEQRKSQKVAAAQHDVNRFEVVALEWIEKNKNTWALGHLDTINQRLRKNVLPYIGHKQITELTASDLLKVLRPIETRGAIETAHRVQGVFGQIFRYAIATGRIASDPSRDLRGALAPAKLEHLASVTEPREVGELLRMLDGYNGSPIVAAALLLSPLVFVRPGELRQAEWSGIDLGALEWRFISSKTKTQLIVPLATQAASILREIHPLTGGGKYVFPSARSFDRPMSDNAILSALRALGIPKEKMCGHGFRAMARTMLDEQLKFPPHIIEQQLAHAVRDPLGRAYNRTQHLQERRLMMQKWADYLDQLKTEGFQ